MTGSEHPVYRLPVSELNSDGLYYELVHRVSRMTKILDWVESTLTEEVQQEVHSIKGRLGSILDCLPELKVKFCAADRDIQELVIHLLRMAVANIDDRFTELKLAAEASQFPK